MESKNLVQRPVLAVDASALVSGGGREESGEEDESKEIGGDNYVARLHKPVLACGAQLDWSTRSAKQRKADGRTV